MADRGRHCHRGQCRSRVWRPSLGLSRQSLTHFVVYWLLFFAFFVTALLLAIWDLRYIRAQYRVDERELFQQTLGEEDFRKRLRDAERRAREHGKDR